MAKLVLSMDGLVLKEITLDQQRLTIGRNPSNDIRIDNLAISGEHASIVTILGDSFIEDLNSTNGTQVNGQPISKRQLIANDVISLGKYALKYLVETPKPEEANLVDSQGAFSPLNTPTPTARAFIEILNGAQAGKSIEIIKEQTTLGKPGVQAGVIQRARQHHLISSMAGMKAPVVNGNSLTTQPIALHSGDIIEISGVKMRFQLVP